MPGDLFMERRIRSLIRWNALVEQVRRGRDPKIPIASALIGADARLAVAVLCPLKYTGGPLDVFRRLGLAAMGREWLSSWVSEFWPGCSSAHIRQRERACLQPGPVASYTDMAGRIVNMLGEAQSRRLDGREATGGLLSRRLDAREYRTQIGADFLLRTEGFEFRLAANAWRDMLGWIRTAARQHTAKDETGGLLFAELNEATGIAWISYVSGPPSGSVFSPEMFVCGTEGTGALCDGYADRTNGNVRYIGTWHSHPKSSAIPKAADFAGIASVSASSPSEGSHRLMLIVGHTDREEREVGAYVFERRDLVRGADSIVLQGRARGVRTAAPSVGCLGRGIGLSLSGGGSRAVAFHLGTLRALEDLHLLDDVAVISGVSGGSVMAGLLGYAQTDFADTDERTMRFLRRGLVKPALWKLLHPKRLVYMLLEPLGRRGPDDGCRISRVVRRMGRAASALWVRHQSYCM